MSKCLNCFADYTEGFDICPHCGTPKIERPLEPIHLAPGTLLAGRYLLGQAIGSGGFGIIYKAWDTKLETIIAVKEFFSARLMTRAEGQTRVIISPKSKDEFEYRKSRFLAEAKNMAKFGEHRSIPNVFEFFEDNGTAYIVMELLNGVGLNTLIKESDGKIDREFAIHVATEVGNALSSLHAQGIIHRDVAPDNIFICSDRELKVKLLDLGAAKLSNSDDTVIDIILKPGYSPTEQYDNTGRIGTWTDVYALGATLYLMLTGVKPDESVNRKLQDTLLPPHEIDNTIPENLSNAVMKAMAIEKHMRFKTASDFLKAIAGQRKIMTLAKEKKRRKRNQMLGISAAILVLLAGGGLLMNHYKQMEEEELLAPAKISIWYCAKTLSEEETAMEFVTSNFMEKFENVSIELRRFDEEEYEDRINEAAEADMLPTLFESTGLSEEVLAKATDLTNVLESEQALACLFLDKYATHYDNKKQLPLGIEVPMAMVVTGGVAQVDYKGTTFASLSDFADAGIAVDSATRELIEKNWTVGNLTEADLLNVEKNVAVLLTTTNNMQQYKDELMSTDWHCAYSSANVNCDFVYEWSIGNGNDDEIMAAERLLSWMLGNNYQNALMISWAQNGEVPVNSTCFEEYCKLSEEYKALSSVKNALVFDK